MAITVSVIVTACKRVPLLEKALQSIIAQTFDDFEIIVVNDWPADAAAVDELALVLNDTRLRVIHQDQSRGANIARNTGIRAAQGSILGFLDDDDRWDPAKLERHLAMHRAEPKVGLVYSAGRAEWLDEQLPSSSWTAGPLPPDVLGAMSRGVFSPGLSTSTVLQECFARCGLFDETLVSFQDWDLWFAMAHEYEFRYIPEELTIVGVHLRPRVSQSVDVRLHGLRQILEKWADEMDVPAVEKLLTRAALYNGIRNAVLCGQRYEAARLCRRLLPLLNPWRDRNWIARIVMMMVAGRRGYIGARNLSAHWLR